MPEGEESSLTTLWLPSAQQQRKLLVTGVLATVLTMAEMYNGSVTRVLRYIKRSCAAAFAQYLEDQGGFPLFTIEGNEPEVTKATWNLPMPPSQQKDQDRAPLSSTEEGQAGIGEDESQADSSSSSDLPNFFASTKFFACLDLLESKELFEATEMVKVQPREVLFRSGEDSQSGIFIVVEGGLGVYLDEGEELRLTNILRTGESVGDLDVLDGALRSVTCMAMEDGATLVSVPRDLFISFIAAKPRTLQIYLHKAMARLWRVAHFVLTDFLELSLEEMPARLTAYPPGIPATAPSALTASMHLGVLPEQSGPLTGAGSLGVPDLASSAPTGSAMGSHARPAGRERHGVRFAPRLEKVSEGQSASSTDGSLANSPGTSPPRPARSARLSGLGDQPTRFMDLAGSKASFGVEMSTPFRDAPLPNPDGDMDGALEQMSTFADAAARTSADEEIYGSSLTGQQGAHFPPRATGKAPLPPKQGASSHSIAQRRAADAEKQEMLSKLRSTATQAGSGARAGAGAEGAAAARRSFSLSRNLSQHLDQGSPAVPVSARLPAPTLNGCANSEEEADSASAAAPSEATEEDQVPEMSDIPMLLSDAEILSSIKSTMTRKQTMSLPLHLLKGNSSLDALENALRAESKFVSPAPSLRRRSMVSGSQATLASGWDVISPEEGYLTEELQERLQSCSGQVPPGASRPACGQHVQLRRGELLHDVDKTVRHFYFLIEGNMLAERRTKGKKKETALLGPGSMLGAAAYLSSTRSRASMRAATSCRLAAFGAHELEALLDDSVDVFVDLLLLAGRALGPIIRRFISLGLNRVWTKAGDTVYRQGEPAESLYILISGRLRLLRADPDGEGPMVVEEEVGRGEAVGAVWALTGGRHDTTALCARDSEFVRMSRGAFEVLAQQNPRATSNMLEGMARRISAASSARSKRRTYISSSNPTRNKAALSMSNRSASEDEKGRGGEIVTIALVPAGSYASWLAGDNLAPAANAALGTVGGKVPSLKQRASGFAANGGAATLAVQKVADALKTSLEELFGPTLHLNASTLEVSFKTAFQRLHTTFYRSKLTSWMAAQEEDYRFIILEADAAVTPWSRICISHADCVLLVGAEEASPQVNLLEEQLVWAPMGPPSEAASIVSSARSSKMALFGPFDPSSASWSYSNSHTGINAERGSSQTRSMENLAAQMRRVEVLLLHQAGSEPSGTLDWLKPRPLLARHHHVRLSHNKDMARVARWMAGKAVGLVLSGGGSRGLAHLGVLHALDDAGVPIDVIGGTSQGAFMAALYAQGLAWERMHAVVREYAGAMGSVRHLLSDLTLPIISVFSGAGFDRVIRQSFQFGAQRIEDLWLSFFCMTTNMTRGEPTVHQDGLLWKLVRASMTIVGLIPPVYENGELLIDGGYLNNMPVDVMRGLGVDTVIVVDVEDRDDSVWHNLTPLDGGLSGWRLLWDRWCPIPSLRYNIKVPRYSQMIAALTWMSHSQNLRRMAREHPIDLYMQPPVTRFRLLDYHLMDRIVRDSNRYAWAAISEWQCHQGMTQGGRLSQAPARGAPTPERQAFRRSRSVACMTQLQAKQKYGSDALSSDSEAPASPDREGNAAAAEAGGKADASPQQADSLEAATSTEGREMSSVARTQSADGGRRSFDSLTSSRSSALPLLPQPYWSCPTSHSVQQEAAPKAAKGQGQDSSDGQPVKNLLPPSLPQLQKHERTEDRAEGSGAGAGGQAEGASAHPGSGRLSSLPIVLSRQNSNSSGEEEEEAASEPDAAGTLSSTSEEATSVEGSAQTTVEVSDSALHAAGAGQQSSEGQWRASAHSNGDAKAGAQQPDRPLSARSFSRSRSSSFSKGFATGQASYSSSAMEDMRAASTGLVDLPEQATNQATAPIRIPIPEMRRPSLPPGRGSLTEMHSAGKSSLPRQLSTHPSHATPPGNAHEGQGSPPPHAPATGYATLRQSSATLRDQTASSFSGVFEFPEGNH